VDVQYEVLEDGLGAEEQDEEGSWITLLKICRT